MSDVNEYAPGTFCWVELATSDTAGAKRFYTELLGWQTEDTPAGPTTYTMLRLRGKELGGLYALGPDQKAQGVPPNWLSYVAVKSADEAAGKITAAGGKILQPPFDVMEHGRMAVAQDPTGAHFAVWQGKQTIGARVVAEPGARCWDELWTKDTQAAGRFYASVFGWTTHEQEMASGSGTYTVFKLGEVPVCGMGAIPSDWGAVPPHWLVYFAVDDCDARVARARGLGAQVKLPPVDIPNVGRFATLQDPQGAAFAVIKLVM
jgi:predicted enzyme related to lactoylglutathione lyase